MEYENENENKVGAGILTICILTFIGSTLGFIGFIGLLAVPSLFTESGITKSYLIISLLMIIVQVIACILILLKQKIGVIIYFIIALISLIITFVSTGFSISALISGLVLPVLMAIFILKKKELYGLGAK